jgi:hypothetical protein
MRDYSPRRRTAVVFAGSGSSGAYHAGVLRALDESGVKLDLVVGSGVGTVAAAFAAVAGGPKLYGKGGFWDGVRFRALYRLRPAARAVAALLGVAFGVFLLPLAFGFGAGLLGLVVLVASNVWPGIESRLAADLGGGLALARGPYLAALAAPVFVLSALAFGCGVSLLYRRGRRAAEAFEWLLSPEPGTARLRRALWEVARGATLSTAPDSEAELGRRYVGLLSENLGQPGFRELILRAADLDAAGTLDFVLVADEHRRALAAARARGALTRSAVVPEMVDLRAPGYDALFFDGVASGLLPPLAAPLRRVAFPRGGLHAGETHRLADATAAGVAGVGAAFAAGAEQVIVVTAVPESGLPAPRRRGLRATADAVLAALERRAVDLELHEAERLNRIVGALGPRREDGGRAWHDPATGRVYRDVAIYVIRPARRALGPLELDGARDPASEVLETPDDLLERGHRDAYRMFVEPVLGAAPEPRGAEEEPEEERQAVEL